MPIPPINDCVISPKAVQSDDLFTISVFAVTISDCANNIRHEETLCWMVHGLVADYWATRSTLAYD